MKHQLDIQIADPDANIPESTVIEKWLASALVDESATRSVCLRIVTREESAALNQHYRKKSYATNVLSFPINIDEFIDLPLESLPLGDIVICDALVQEEANARNITYEAHLAHLFIHGILHCQGYDHINEEDAVIMENKETRILASLGYADPYQKEELK